MSVGYDSKSSETEGLFEKVFPEDLSITRFQNALIRWFETEGKTYPWRETEDPYPILVSELMLQQTQIATVLGRGYFQRWMDRFPTWQDLAEAEEGDLLKTWEGLGYYNRARNLQKTALAVISEHGGEFPGDYDSILSLPGVGPYTAGAVMSFAYDKKAAIVDGNVIRVLSRIFGYGEAVDTTASGRFFWGNAGRLTPEKKVRQYNSGIMELGQQVCTRSSPSCGVCPVSAFCVARSEGLISQIPAKKKKAETIRREEHVGIVIDNRRILLTLEEGSRRQGLRRLPELSEQSWSDFEEVFRFDYAITKYKVSLRVHLLPRPVAAAMKLEKSGEWYPFENIESLPPMGSPYLKAIKKYQNLHDELNLTS